MTLEDREIRATDTRRDHLQLHLAGAGAGLVELLDRDLPNLATDGSLHAFPASPAADDCGASVAQLRS